MEEILTGKLGFACSWLDVFLNDGTVSLYQSWWHAH